MVEARGFDELTVAVANLDSLALGGTADLSQADLRAGERLGSGLEPVGRESDQQLVVLAA